ncbi:MAG: NTE family protein [Parvicellaceae bacterium]|jgi:NTE family protein
MVFSKINFTVLVLFLGLGVYGQSDTIKNMVFEGAGIRGIAYAGAVQELERQGKLDYLEKVGGTSAGAITALAISLGCTGKEAEELVADTKFKQFNDGEFIFIGGIARMFKKYGWYKHKKFRKWLMQIIEEETGDSEITLQTLHDSGYVDLYVTSTILDQQRVEVFSYENYPDMKVVDAVQISMSIPLYFESLFINTKGEIVNPKKYKGEMHLAFDGGVTANFPIFIFDSTYTENGVVKRIANPSTVGFRIDTDEQIEFDAEGKGIAPMEIGNLKGYLGALYNLTIETLNRQTLSNDDWERTVSISSGDVGPKIRKLKPEEKEQLLYNGKNGVEVFFSEN